MARQDQSNTAAILWRSISTRVMGVPNRTVLVLGANGDEGARAVTLAAAEQAVAEGLKVCVVSLEATTDPASAAARTTTIDVGPYGFTVEHLGAAGPDLLVLKLDGPFMRDLITHDTPDAPDHQGGLRRQLRTRLNEIYDFVLFTGGSVLQDPYSLLFAAEVAGVFMVVRAGRTRLPVFARARSLIEAHQGTVIGAILTDRKYYIPRWLYDRL